MVSMKLEDAQVRRMRLIPGLQLQVILLILSGAPGLAWANGTRCCRISRISVVETIAAPATARMRPGAACSFAAGSHSEFRIADWELSCSESCRLLESAIRNPQWKDRGGAAIIRVHAKS